MSIRIMTMVYERKLGDPSLKAVLLKLADYANDKGGNIWPAFDTVADQTELSRSTVKRAVRTAKKRELLVLEMAGGNGAGNTNRYRIDLTRLQALPLVSEEGGHGDPLIDEGGQGDPLKGATVTQEGGQGDPQSINRTIIQPSNRKCEGETSFEAFWELYPRKVGKVNARKAFEKAREQGLATGAELVKAVRRYAASRVKQDPKFTLHPATWLNGQRWLDDPEPTGSRQLQAAIYDAGPSYRNTDETFAEYAERMKREGKWRPAA